MNITSLPIFQSPAVAAMPIGAGAELTQFFQNLVTDFGAAQPVGLTPPGSVLELEPANNIASEANIAPTLPVIPCSAVEPVVANRLWQMIAVSPTPTNIPNVHLPSETSDEDDAPDAETVAIASVTDAAIATIALPVIVAIAPTFSQNSTAQNVPKSPSLEILPKPVSAETPVILPAQMPVLSGSPALPSALPAIIPQDLVITGHLDLARDTLWLDQLTREIVAAASNDGRLRFTLSPQALGSLDVAITSEAGGVNVQLQTSSESATRIMAAEQPKLAEELRQSGVKLVNNDLINNQQMGSRGEHSQPRDFASQTPIRVSGHAPIDRNTASSSSKRLSGRFA
jgi:flagellar hook-length control protein FliK